MQLKSTLIAGIFFITSTQPATMYYLDIRAPGESLFGGKRLFHLYDKAPKKYVALCLVEYKPNGSRRIEPLLSHEYNMFFLASGFIFFVPKCNNVILRTLIYDEDGDIAQDLSKALATHQGDFPAQLKIIHQMLGLNDNSVELWFYNPDDFCDRLQNIYPHEDAWPCCAAKNESSASPLPLPVDEVVVGSITTAKELDEDGWASPMPLI